MLRFLNLALPWRGKKRRHYGHLFSTTVTLGTFRNMEQEITDAVFPIMTTLVSKDVAFQKTELFIKRLSLALQKKFEGHWYPENPSKGEAYRCIRVNRHNRNDPELLRACHESGLRFCDLRLPLDFTLWINPGEAFCRIGEENPPFSVATVAAMYEEYLGAHPPNTSDDEMSDCDSFSSSDGEDALSCFSMSNCTQLNPLAPAWYPSGFPKPTRSRLVCRGTRERFLPLNICRHYQCATAVRQIKMK
ncbi:protein BTG3-like isoform X2 [Phycodurus eques]|uniref:protein BTG3-like isoform X2 n=1 Tax=Phycodurus eques TaxID=693459 RepID=UPI002ACEE0D5|nr:protein BTG3-like isoform X2 [Phycodurus eques]